MVDGRPLECLRGEWWSAHLRRSFFFLVSKRKRKVRGWREREGEQERLFSFGIWILGHTGPGVSQSGQSEGGGWAGGPRRAD